MALPAAAAAAYQAIAKIGVSAPAQAGPGAVTGATQSFGDFLSSAVKDSIGTMKQGETMAMKQIAGQADIVDVVNAVNQAELTLNTVVAVRDKVIQAYQSIMQMPI
ncbi:MAG TPA: flagellar hook-basal body complex protein FliE [Rhizomicrobium sp.]|jgi:flagellar hook-basal body complex protein FliE|nr:flagellar hook-basal body complex protein FliE [Rhizomicrobium sp.]